MLRTENNEIENGFLKKTKKGTLLSPPGVS